MKEWLWRLLALLCGAAGVLSYAPFDIWPAFLITVSGLLYLIHHSDSAKTACLRGLFVGLGFFGAGVSWIYISVATYGQVGIAIAVLVTLSLIVTMAGFYAIASWITYHLQQRLSSWPMALILSSSLLVTEWGRSHFLTGFPWLLPGYAVHHTPLFEWSPVGGIWFLSLITLLSFSLLAGLLCQPKRRQIGLLVLVSLFWGAGFYFQQISPDWTIKQDSLKVTLVQGNLSQDEKWLREQAAPTLSYYQQTTIDHLDSDLVVWPETAITYLLDQIQPHLTPFIAELEENNTTLITGVPVQQAAEDDPKYYNAIWSTGEGFGLYLKRRLVPFGEYIPFAEQVGPILDLFGMPMSSFSKGEDNQPVLQVRDWGAAPFICYEIVYPDQVRQLVRDSDFLVTISNDGWFGASIGPLQHLQIAQFRAKESGRYLIRSTNTGVSAIVDNKGKIVMQLPQFVRTSGSAQISTTTGNTPYVLYGSTVLWIALFLMWFGQALFQGLILRPVSVKTTASPH